MDEAEVARSVLAELDQLVEELGRAYQAEVPEYASLGERLATEVLPVSREIVANFFSALETGGDPTVDAVEPLSTMGRRRLEMGVPLEPMLHVYRVAGAVVWQAIVDVVGDGDASLLGAVGSRWIDYIDRASSVAAAGYLEASHDRIRRLDARRDALLEELLAASDDSDVAAVAAEHNLRLAEVFVPVVLWGEITLGRLDRIADRVPSGSIVGQRADAALVLVPEHAQSPSMADELAAAGEATILVTGEPAAPGRTLASAVRAVERILATARRFGHLGRFGPDALALERLVTSDHRAAEAMGALLDELVANDRQGTLVETLVTYLDAGSIPRCSQALVVHPNTVSYRLGRVAELTGLEPRRPAEATLLHLGLISRGLWNPQS